MFKLKIGEIPEAESLELDDLYQRWQRSILWKAANLEDLRHAELCTSPERGWCRCRTRQEEVHEWEDWIIDNYDLPDERRNWRIPRAVLARITTEKHVSAPAYHEPVDADIVGERGTV